MKSIHFAITDLWRRKWISLLLLIQITLLLFISNFAIASIKDLKKMKQEVTRLTMDTPIYFMKDFTTEAHFDELIDDDNKRALHYFEKLYDTLYGGNYNADIFSLFSNSLPFDKELFRESLDTITYEGNYADVPTLNATDELKQYFKLEVAEGRYFNQTEYADKKKIKPIVIGSELAKSISLHEVIQDAGGDQYKVIGILKSGMSYIDISSNREFISLDNTILYPQNKYYMTGGMEYYALLSATYIATSDETIVKDIVEKGNNHNLFTWTYSDLSQQVKYVIQDKTKWIQMQLMLTLLILIFTFISITVAYLQFIIQYTYEFGVHILSGATKKDIIFRVCMQLVLLFVLANSISAIFMHDANQLITSFIITIVSCLLLWIIPIVKIMRTTIDQMLRWR